MTLSQGIPSPAGPSPPDLMGKQLSFLPPVVMDSTPSGTVFGSVLLDAEPTYTAVRFFNSDFLKRFIILK